MSKGAIPIIFDGPEFPGAAHQGGRPLQSFHEHRQYKKGFKVCEQILKRCPQHAETLSMKGLFLGLMGRKEEGYELAKQAIKYNFRSHVCWHVYGLLYRNDKNYDEAVKCYRTALKFDSSNGQILRDLVVLQLQLAQYEGHLETRVATLKGNPQVKSSWIGLALAHHLCGNYAEAIQTLEEYTEHLSEATGVAPDTVLDPEMGEIQLYRAQIMKESGDLEGCLVFLLGLKFRGGDQLRYHSMVAELHLALGVKDKALAQYKKLFALVPESLEYLKGLGACHDLEGEEKVLLFLREMKNEFPQSLLLKQHFLHRLSGDNFAAAFKDYALPLIKKGAPSVFQSVKGLYDLEGFVASIEELVKGFLDTFRNMEDKRGQFWSLYFLALHYDHEGVSGEALRCLDAAYALNNTTPDLFLLYGRLLKHSGYLEEAVECMEHARRMDLGDRFLNSKAVKYMLRAGDVERAKATLALFLKEGPLNKQLADLAEIQCIWWDLELGRCLVRRGETSDALECFDRVTRLFDEFVDDQLDFHNYALRKLTLSHYVGLLRYERVLYAEPVFRDAALNYLQLSKCDSKDGTLEGAMQALSLDTANSVSRVAYLKEKLRAFHGDSPAVKALFGDECESSDEAVTDKREILTEEQLAQSPFLQSLP